MLTVYAHQKCSTCRDALRWLDERGISHQVKAIRETPPTAGELRAALDDHGGEIRRLFNTSGMDYRALGLAAKLPGMARDEALALLASNGMLVKRPFVTGGTRVVLGFKPALWEETLAK